MSRVCSLLGCRTEPRWPAIAAVAAGAPAGADCRASWLPCPRLKSGCRSGAIVPSEHPSIALHPPSVLPSRKHLSQQIQPVPAL